ncbi:MAG: flippase [Candidatus Omnitrophica bacterium]|nr:flippase [Candidatus Omnitrophota bacterium]
MHLKSVFQNIVSLLVKRIVEYLFLFLLIVYAGRTLGPSQFGKLNFAFAFTSLFIILSDLGFRRYLNREVAKNLDESRKTIQYAFTLKIFFALIVELVIIIAINLMGYDTQTKILVYILGIYIIFKSYQEFINDLFRGLKKAHLEAYSEFFEKPLLLLCGVGLLQKGYGVTALVWLFLILKVISCMFTFFLYRAHVGSIVLQLPSLQEGLALVKLSAPYALFLCFAMLYLGIDTVLLSYIKGDVSVGIYQVAVKVGVVLMLFPEAITQSVLPHMVAFYYTDKKRLLTAYIMTIKSLFFIASFIGVYLFFFSRWILQITFGPAYFPALPLFSIIAGMILFRFLIYGSATMLNASGNQPMCTVIEALCVLINIVLNIMLIPKYDYMGAGVATLATNALVCGIYFLMVKMKTGASFPAAFFLKMVLTLCIVAGGTLFIPFQMLFYRALYIASAFILVSYILQLISKEELYTIRHVLTSNLAQPF